MAFGEVCGHRACRPNDLIGEAFEWCRHPDHERDCDPGGFESLAVGDEAGLLDRVTSWLFMHSPQPLGWLMSRVASEAIRHALDMSHPSGYLYSSEQPGVIMLSW